MCITPVTLKREKPLTNIFRKDSGFTDVVPCGNCPVCLSNRSSGWAFRLLQETKHSSSSAFITLTYDDKNVPWIDTETDTLQTLVKKDFQDFMKRLRKQILADDIKERPKLVQRVLTAKGNPAYYKDGKPKYKSLRQIKYYACGEYGGVTERPHYHAVIFNMPLKYTQVNNFLMKAWNQGFVHLGRAEIGSITYVVKYVMKSIDITRHDNRQSEFALMSKGLGIDYLSKAMLAFARNEKSAMCTLEGGKKFPMPRYYKDKIFTETEKWFIQAMAEVEREKNPKPEKSAKDEIEHIKNVWRRHNKKQKLERQKV